MARNDAPRPSSTVQVVTSGGQATRKRQLCCPTATGGRRSPASRRMAECSPSAPTTRSNSPSPPSSKPMPTGPSTRSSEPTVRPSRTGTPSRRTWCRSTLGRARHGPTSPHSSRRSMSASSRPRWSSRRWLGIGAARLATAASRPSARRARTPLAGRYMPVPAPFQASARSITSGANPACRSALASARPASPAPTTRIRQRSIPQSFHAHWPTRRCAAVTPAA